MKRKFSCTCQELSHTIDTTIPIFKELYNIIKLNGEIIPVTIIDKGSYLVPRIYIAMHGLKVQQIDRLGFVKIRELYNKK